MKTFGDDEQLYRVGEGDYRILYTIRGQEFLVLVLKTGACKAVSRS
jgi:mRNA-degrading endonuclease RelE of RelBE toxin-antitoxin system